jgi:hypothetical protein
MAGARGGSRVLQGGRCRPKLRELGWAKHQGLEVSCAFSSARLGNDDAWVFFAAAAACSSPAASTSVVPAGRSEPVRPGATAPPAFTRKPPMPRSLPPCGSPGSHFLVFFRLRACDARSRGPRRMLCDVIGCADLPWIEVDDCERNSRVAEDHVLQRRFAGVTRLGFCFQLRIDCEGGGEGRRFRRSSSGCVIRRSDEKDGSIS